MTKRLLGVGLLVLFSAVSWGDAVDDYVRGKMAENRLPGVGFAVVDPAGKTTYRCYGVASLETKKPFTTTTVHRIASLSKQLCAYVALSLIRDGRMSLDDPVRKWLPDAPVEWQKMTVWHLMTHTSGIPNPDNWDMTADYSLGDYVALLSIKPLDGEPGTAYRYNNHGYSLLGEICGIAGSSSLPDLAKRFIFGPAGMKATHYYGDWRPGEILSDGYQWKDGKHFAPERKRPLVYSGSGGVFSTLEDMVRYEKALRNGVLDHSLLEQQWTTQNPHLSNYGYGWQVWDGDLRHTGTTYGFTSAFYRDLKDGWSIILFRTAEEGSQMDMAMDILKLWRMGGAGV